MFHFPMEVPHIRCSTLITINCLSQISFAPIYTVGVSLVLLGQAIPNNSLVNFDDLAYQAPVDGFREAPTNANERQTLMCVTDLVASPMLGDWYYPDGNRVTGMGSPVFRTNRGQNENSGEGLVRIWRYYTPSERGLFHCKLPDADGVVQTRYVNICKLPMILNAYSSILLCFPQCFFAISLDRILSQ